ncbi:MAG: hypothetical protein K2L27_04515 [Muribaculaceae bacterium]|nr:hypothetical protein [Muribaculaceae bacterium]
MKKFFTLTLAVVLACCVSAAAQIVTTSPAVLQMDSQDVVLYYHADSPLGDGGLKGYASGDVYAHIGVTTQAGDWQHVPATWDVNLPKCKTTRVGADTYSLTIGDIRTFFGLTDSEEASRICLVFRNADGSRSGKAAGGNDIFVDVQPAGLALVLDCSAPEVISAPAAVTLTASASVEADIEISVNGTKLVDRTAAKEAVATYSIASPGMYEFKAVATAGGKTVERTAAVTYAGESVAADYPGGVPVQGAVDNADGTVTFCLAAPGKSSVVLVPSWSGFRVLPENTMKYQDYGGYRYFWITSPRLDDATDYLYYYLVDGTRRVGDPYARLVLDPYSDKWLSADGLGYEGMPEYPAEVTGNVMLAVWRRDMNKYDWSDFTIPAHDRLYVYEMLLRDFTGTEGQSRGNGTLAAAMEKIPYIKSLGVNAVELMPIMEFNGNNSWGYNTNFYMAPDKAYGSPKEYKDFIDACHREGLAVILDVVFNQTDGLTPWYQMYPVGSNPFYNASAPHAYSVLNDLNPSYELVEQHYKDVVRYWLTEYNVDGFRFDLVKGLGDNDSYGAGTDANNRSRTERMKRIHAAMKEVKPDAIHINELLGAVEEENANAADGQIGWHNLNYNASQFAMHYGEGGTGVADFYAPRAGRTAWHSMAYAESHDEERVAYSLRQYGAADVKTGAIRGRRLAALGAWMVLTPGPKMIWQFQELGNDESTKSSDGGNNTAPKRVNWSAMDNLINKHIYAAYSTLGSLRAANADMFGEGAEFACSWSASPDAPRSLCVRKGGRSIVAFFNPSATAAQDVTVTSTGLETASAELIYASEGFASPALSGSGGTLRLNVPANGFAVYATAGISGISDAVADGDALAPEVTVAGGVGEIIVSGADRAPEVYDLGGRRVGTSGLAAGLYVVRAGGKSFKVIVR